MGFIKSIYFPDDLHELLKKEPNLSGLIASLLRKHWKNNNSEKNALTLEEIREKKKLLDSEAEKQDEAVKALENMEKEIIEAEEEKTEKEKGKNKTNIETYKDWIKNFFEVQKEDLQAQAEQYNAEKDGFNSLWDWGIQKGLIEKTQNDK